MCTKFFLPVAICFIKCSISLLSMGYRPSVVYNNKVTAPGLGKRSKIVTVEVDKNA